MIVNGIPGSGKTTLAKGLAQTMNLPLFSKDSVKETLADMLGPAPDGLTAREWSQRLGAAAAEMLWTLLADSCPGAVLESPWLAHLRPIVLAGLDRAQVDVDRVHEIWCEVPLDFARRRFAERAAGRHPVHVNDQNDDAGWGEWSTQAEPLALGHVHVVDTTSPVDLTQLVARIRRAHSRSALGTPRAQADPVL
ncbi:AAA family ATPase [Phytoactinopolyspora halotolerans]|uniref:AAA family ATPase n=1 Tax=Phytoactinopolyspora halotolerans TaxID=1981512 RepID=A0A6L9SDG8_9ACTN|nr:AAA family ATPase [Phytoactinopolyspora halotolerans]